MRTTVRWATAAAIVGCVLQVGIGMAQTTPCAVGTLVTGNLLVAGVKNAPFSGTAKVTVEQRLGDGNVIRTSAEFHQGRDAAGRTRTEMLTGCFRGSDGKPHQTVMVIVSDPTSGTYMNWQMGDDMFPKVVNVAHVSVPPPMAKPATPPDPQALARRRAAAQMRPGTEDLGEQDFFGVTAKGTRTTITVPAGEQGNEQPLVSTSELWRSLPFGVTMREVNDDPLRGKTVMEYEEFNRGEPDASLFAAPEGYTLKELPPTGGGLPSLSPSLR